MIKKPWLHCELLRFEEVLLRLDAVLAMAIYT
jgi:hypothetical protein